MFRLLAGLGAGCVITGVLLIGSLTGTGNAPVPAQPNSPAIAALQAAAIDRTHKTDRLPAPAVAAAQPEQHRIAVIEVVGVRDAAIVYRDRDGQVLFRTDPLSNVTVVVKNTLLPEVTVRETVRTAADRVPLMIPDAPPKARVAPVGCESALGPMGSPSQPAPIDRCISDAGTLQKFSAVQ